MSSRSHPPAAGSAGTATIALTVSDVLATASTSFTVVVTPAVMHTLSLQPSDRGAIVADPALAEYGDQAEVWLAAQPAEGFAFAAWGGDAAGVTSPLRLLMDANKSVSATFHDVAGPSIHITSPSPGPKELDVFDLTGSIVDNVGVVSAEWELDDKPGPLSASDVNGLPLAAGLTNLDGMARLSKRRITGDINGNDRWDVNDASLLSRMIVAGVAPDRPWDLGLNDINKNNRLDSSDVAQIMRVAAGLDPQPQSQAQVLGGGGEGEPVLTGLDLDTARSDGDGAGAALHGGPVPRAVLIVPVTTIRGGQQFTVQVRLEDVVEPITGAAFKLLYPIDALRLARADSYRQGALVPASAQKLWNPAPDLGSIAFACSGTNAWAAATGVLAEFDFEVVTSVPDESGFALQVINLELAREGYGLTPFQVPQASLESNVQYPTLAHREFPPRGGRPDGPAACGRAGPEVPCRDFAGPGPLDALCDAARNGTASFHGPVSEWSVHKVLPRARLCPCRHRTGAGCRRRPLMIADVTRRDAT